MEDWLAAAAARRPAHPFLETPRGTLSFAEVEERVARAAGGLLEQGVRVGDRVGVRASGDPAGVVAMLAVPRVGGVSVLLGARLAPPEVRDLVLRAGVSALVGVPVSDLDVPVLSHPEAAPAPPRRPDPSTLHSVVFTSGSTGRPRGVRLTWGNLEASAAASAAHLRHAPADRWLCALPLHHVGGLSILVRSAREASTVLLEPRFDPARAAHLLRDGTATLASLVAAMLRRIVQHEPGPYRGVRAVLLGGGPAPPELLEEAAEAGLPVLPSYGMTETASQVATARLEDAFRPHRPMRPLRGVEIGVGRDQVLRVRGGMVSPGYLDEPDRPEGGWLVTGDLGELGDDGSVTVLGRADDVIVTGGENVHPLEVETVLRAHPGVEEVVVVGVPDPTWGSRVVAVYEGVAAPGELERHARFHLSGFKLPRRWLRVDRVPRAALGKPDREGVRALAAARAPVVREPRGPAGGA